MNKTFIFESDGHNTSGLCDEIEIEIRIHALNEDEAGWEYENIYNKTKDVVMCESDFSKKELVRIEKIADRYAQDNAYDVYFESLIDKAESMRE